MSRASLPLCENEKDVCTHGEVDILVTQGDQNTPFHSFTRTKVHSHLWIPLTIFNKCFLFSCLFFMHLLLVSITVNILWLLTICSPYYMHPLCTLFFYFYRKYSTLDSQALENELLNCSIHRCLSRSTFFLAVDEDKLMIAVFAH